MTYSPIFEVDRDTVRSKSLDITYKSISDNEATLTTSEEHEFTVGIQVKVVGVDDTFDGTWLIDSVTIDTFSYHIIADPVSSTAVSGGIVLGPSPAYIRYDVNDTILDNFSSKTNFHAEAWDYNTVRIFWSLEDSSYKKIIKDINNSLTPLIAVTRSMFGYPVTPIDGEKIFEEKYMDVVSSSSNRNPAPFFETQKASTDNDFQRPIAPVQSLYDRNLSPGRWHYYSLFFYLQGDYETPRWVPAGQVSALTPYNHKHSDKFYDLVPPYYRIKDEQYSGTTASGTLKKILNAVGFEADYTRTLAESVENIYNIDEVNSLFMHLLGETNLGVTREDSLGDIRYRSLIAAINSLYAERGSTRGIRNLTVAATKYKAKVIEGINMLSLTDDAEFAFDTGSWADIAAYVSHIDGGTVNVASITAIDATESPSTRKRAMKLKSVSGDPTNHLVIACGLGTGNIINRLHVSEPYTFYPHLNAVRCESGKIYRFSFYSKRIGSTAGDVYAGIMWFNLPVNHTFNWSTDFISKSESTFTSVGGADTTSIQRYYSQEKAPLSKKGEAYIYGVPYIRFTNSSERRIYACMFSPELNSAENFAVIQPDFTLTLGAAEYLNTDKLLGDQ